MELPPQPPAPDTPDVIDWHRAKPPPTWRHRVIPVTKSGRTYYDEAPDPAVAGELKFFKALIGARTSLSTGKGGVKDYRESAQKAGYSLIVFAEAFELLDKKKWERLVQQCKESSNHGFVCLPGFTIEDFEGNTYLIISPNRFPRPQWLSPDGKKLKAVRMLSLGFFGHIASIHHPGMNPLQPELYKHFQAVTVYTYDGEGRMIDDGFYTYQWQIRSESNPIPIVVHELDSPEQVGAASKTGFQQILAGTNLSSAVDYFRYALVDYLDCPVRYFISEGPVLTGWSILNKDIGRVEENRDHWLLGIEVMSDEPITEVTLYDGYDIARRWYPNEKVFGARVDGFHNMQHEFMLIARDRWREG